LEQLMAQMYSIFLFVSNLSLVQLEVSSIFGLRANNLLISNLKNLGAHTKSYFLGGIAAKG
jgi:hypothetical protein